MTHLSSHLSPQLSRLDVHQDRLDLLGASFQEIRHDMDQQKTDDIVLTEKMHRLEEALDRQQQLIQKMHLATSRPALDRGPPALSSRENEAFGQYLRKGLTLGSEVSLDPVWRHTKSLRATDPQNEGNLGGDLVPQEISHQIHSLLEEASFFRKIASVTTVSTESLELLMDKGEAGVGWAGEIDPREETSTPELTQIRIPVHELYARPRATQRLLDDAFLDVENWLAQKVAEQMAVTESHAFVNGDGNGKPSGFLTYPRASTGGEWGKIETLSTGTDGEFPAENPADCLVEMFYRLKPAYLKDAVWLMSRSAQAAVRKLKDSNGLYFLWQPNLSHEALPTLLGYPVYVTDHMPALTPGTPAPCLAFGNFKQAYHVVDRQGLHILRDPYSAKPYVEFYITKRLGGCVVNFEALKLLDFRRCA